VVDRSEGYFRPDLVVEILEHVIIKLLGIVNDDFLWDTIAKNNDLPEKFHDGCRASVCNGLRLNLFYEILNHYNSEGVVALD
jgi:hypothetical protein